MEQKKNKKKKEKWVDDGRVIAPMNVDGMPWYDNRQFKDSTKSSGETSSDDFDFNTLSKDEKKEYRKQTRYIIFGIMKYVIPLMAVFILVFALLIKFLTIIW